MSAVKSRLISVKNAVAGAALSGATALALAQSAPTTPMQLLTSQSGTFLADTRELIFAGAALSIGAYLVVKLVNLVIQFFKRG